MNSNWWPAVATFASLAGFASFVIGIGYQVWMYLQYGSWVSLDIVTVGLWLGVIHEEWALFPNSWVGLHHILSFLNAGFTALILSLVFAAAVVSD